MKIYLCARYSRRDELREIRDTLFNLGHVVVSQWLDTNWEKAIDRNYGSSAAPPEHREKYAQIDMNDVIDCDCLIAFTEQPKSEHSRGGRHVEFGIALALNKRLIVVDHRENLFHYHPRVQFVENTANLVAMLKGEKDDLDTWSCR